MQTKYISCASTSRPGLLQKTMALAWTAVLVGLALMFSAMLLTAVLVIAVFGGALLWWKTREFRKRMREQAQNFPPRSVQMENGLFGDEVHSGEVIEGEAIRVHEPDVGIER